MSNEAKAVWVSLSVTTGSDIVGAVANITYWRRDTKGVGRIDRVQRTLHATSSEAWDAIKAWQAGPDGNLF